MTPKQFTKNFTDNKNDVYNHIFNRVNNKLVAEELTNDVFMKIYKHYHAHDNKLTIFSVWLSKVVNSTTIDYWRRNKNQPICSQIDDIKSTFESQDVTPYNVLTNKETISNIKIAMFKLPIKQKRIANLFFFHGYKMKIIAAKFNMPINTVKNHIFNLRKTLQTELKYEIV